MHSKRNYSSPSPAAVPSGPSELPLRHRKVAKRARGTFEIEEAWGQKQRGHEAIINRAMSFGPKEFLVKTPVELPNDLFTLQNRKSAKFCV